MIGAFDTTSPLTQTDFYVVYIFSVCQLIGIFFLIRLSFVFQVVSDNSSSESTSPTTNNDKKSKGRTGWPQHVWASELKNWREEKKKENRVDRTSGNRKKCSDAHARQWSVRYCFRVWCLRTECCDQIQSCQENILKLQSPS